MKVKKIRVSIPGNFIKKVLSRLTQFGGKVIPLAIQINVFLGYLLIIYQSCKTILVCLYVFFSEIRVFVRIFPYF